MAQPNRLLPLLDTRLWVGAGAIHNKSLEGIQDIMKNVDIDGIVFGSITMEEKPGNPGNTFYACHDYTINSIGLRNLGYQKYADGELEKVVSFVHGKGKKIIVSVAGDSPEQYAILTELAFRAGADGAELNFSCPNKWGEDGMQKEIAAYNIDLMKAILDAVYNRIDEWSPYWCLGVKVSPYEPERVSKAAALFNTWRHMVDYVSTSNTIPNCYEEDENGASRITKHPGNQQGLGGKGGRILKPKSLAQVEQFRKELEPDIAIMGMGGIYTGKDMYEYFQKGADAVQVCSAFYETEYPGIFSAMLAECWEYEHAAMHK